MLPRVTQSRLQAISDRLTVAGCSPRRAIEDSVTYRLGESFLTRTNLTGLLGSLALIIIPVDKSGNKVVDYYPIEKRRRVACRGN